MAVPIVMPKLGMVMIEGTIVRWAKSPGEVVSEGDLVAEIETEKLNYDLEATGGGILYTVEPEGVEVPVDGVMGYLLAEGESPPEAPPKPAPAPVPETRDRRAQPAPRPPGGEVRSTPGARRLAAKLDVDISEVAPTGPGGRIVEQDVRGHAERKAEAEKPTLPPGLPTPVKTVPLEGMRKTIADHMRGSVTSTAQLSFFLEIDVTEAQRLRRKAAGSGDANITIGNVLMKAYAETLKRHPEFNTILADGTLYYFDDINMGVAVSLRGGLIVPVVRQVDKKSLVEITRETQELVDRAREGKLLPDDVVGGTVTISVLGSVDGFTPILGAGQSAVLGVGRSVDKPVVKGGEVVVREMMTASLTVDHQVTDGAGAASFLRRFRQIIERPAALFK